eukprot:GEMP01057704.1.p1 GENE.GEMP01057704.1~~GEMP01057704.1.p1  ORF type:complete len:335 (+),score=79.72 GEMP01057704.1:56-1006(+)
MEFSAQLDNSREKDKEGDRHISFAAPQENGEIEGAQESEAAFAVEEIVDIAELNECAAKLIQDVQAPPKDVARLRQHLERLVEYERSDSFDGARQTALAHCNLGCLAKRTGDPKAIDYLEKAVEEYRALQPAERRALCGALLNLSAAQQDHAKYQSALLTSLDALNLTAPILQEPDAGVNDFCMVSLCYYSIGTAKQHLRQWAEASLAQHQAVAISRRMLGNDHPLTVQLSMAPAIFPRICPTIPFARTDLDIGTSNVKCVVRGRPNDTRISLSRFAQEYDLRPHWDEWPPRNTTATERHWYREADRALRTHRERK